MYLIVNISINRLLGLPLELATIGRKKKVVC